MKIIEIMDNLSVAGGVNSFAYDLCFAIKEQGSDVTLIAIMKNRGTTNQQVEKLQRKGIKVICLGAKNKLDAILHYVKILRRQLVELSNGDQTICNLHLKLGVLMGCLAGFGLKNLQLVETYHSLYSHYWLQNFVLQSRIKKFIACSKSAMEEMEKRFCFSKKKLTYVSNGVNRDFLLSKKLEYSAKEFIDVISIGRFTDQKNFGLTAEAFSKLCSEQIRYSIIGEGVQKEQIVNACNGNAYISIKPPMERDEIIQVLSQADLLVMPSLWEGLSILLLEAMTIGTPLMLSDIASFTDTLSEKPLEQGETWRICKWGFLISNSSENGYGEALKYYAEHKELRKTFSENVMKLSVQYGIDKTAAKYLDIFKTMFN